MCKRHRRGPCRRDVLFQRRWFNVNQTFSRLVGSSTSKRVNVQRICVNLPLRLCSRDLEVLNLLNKTSVIRFWPCVKVLGWRRNLPSYFCALCLSLFLPTLMATPRSAELSAYISCAFNSCSLYSTLRGVVPLAFFVVRSAGLGLCFIQLPTVFSLTPSSSAHCFWEPKCFLM